MDELRPESIAEESKRLQAEWQMSSQPESPIEPAPDGVPLPKQSYWTPPEPEPPATGRRVGWLLVVIAAGAIIGFGAYLGLPESTDPDDGGWGEIAFVVSPIIALVAALAMSAVLWVVGLLRLADISVYRARDAGLLNLIEQTRGQLGRNPSDAERQQLEYVLSEASRALDWTERYVPR